MVFWATTDPIEHISEEKLRYKYLQRLYTFYFNFPDYNRPLVESFSIMMPLCRRQNYDAATANTISSAPSLLKYIYNDNILLTFKWLYLELIMQKFLRRQSLRKLFFFSEFFFWFFSFHLTLCSHNFTFINFDLVFCI